MARKSRAHIINDAEPEPPGQVLAPRQITKQEFGRRLTGLLYDRGWRQSELARRSGVGKDSISVYVNGRSFPTPLNLQKLARAFGLKPDELLPNHAAIAIAADEPSFEIKASPGDPTVAWVRLNRLMSLETAVQIATLVQADAADRK